MERPLLRILIFARGMSQSELAVRSAIVQPRLSEIERGARDPSDAERRALEAVFPEVPSETLFAGIGEGFEVLAARGGGKPLDANGFPPPTVLMVVLKDAGARSGPGG